MSCANRIFRLGNSAQGGKLRARFVGDIPTAVQIKGTSDVQNVKIRTGPNGQRIGKWVSKNKYQSRMVTLQLIRNNAVYKECKYDACGDLIVDRPDVVISNPSLRESNGTVTLTWTATTELSLDLYIVERKLPGTSVFEAFEGEEPLGAGTTYSEVDVPGIAGVVTYRLKAVFLDGTEKVLFEQAINLTGVSNSVAIVPGSFIAPFSSGIAAVEFITSVENNLQTLFLDRNIEGDTEFRNVHEFSAAGPGSRYKYDDFPGAIGIIIYRVRAKFNDGTEVFVDQTQTQAF